MPPSTRLTAEHHAALLDVHVLDVLAVIEALLRQARELQRQSLRARGIPAPTSSSQRRRAADKIGKCVREMRDETTELSGLLPRLEKLAATIEAAADREPAA